MNKILDLDGNSKKILKTMLDMYADSSIDPYHHLSEIVQNELDAGATDITIKFVRRGGNKNGDLREIVIEGNGFGFRESFERYSQNQADSIKNKDILYQQRKVQGLSRGQFCLGMLGFRGVFQEMHVINKTKEGMNCKNEEDEYFTKMYKNREMVLRANNEQIEIVEEDKMKIKRDSHGVTTRLIEPRMKEIKSDRLVGHLAIKNRNELSKKNIEITVFDYTFRKKVKPIEPKGDKKIFKISHPRKKGVGDIYAELVFHEERQGSKVRLEVEKETNIYNIIHLEEFNKPPWDSDCVEGFIEHPYLKKSPTRMGIIRDDVFFPAFVDMMEILAKQVRKEIKAYEQRTKAKHNKKMMNKINQVMGDVKRELDFWYTNPSEKPQLGSLERIKVFTDVMNIQAETTCKLQVWAYDTENHQLKEKDDISFEWLVDKKMGKIIPKNDGIAIFKAYSIIGPTTINVNVTDNRTDKVCEDKIDVLVTYPVKSGKLFRVKIKPNYCILGMNQEQMFSATAEDKDGNEISKKVEYFWKIIEDETSKAILDSKEGENVILKVGNNVGSIKLRVFAEQFGKRVEDYTVINVTELKDKTKKKRKQNDAGLPNLDWATDLPIPGINLPHSKLSKDYVYLYCYENHPDYKKAKAKGSKYHTRYIANLYAKELAKKRAYDTNEDFGELFLDILSKMDRFF